MRLVFTSLLVLACACSEPSTDDLRDAAADAAPTRDLSRCPGETPPSLESCTAGVFHADCGGSGEPVLACNFQNCKWFAGGCPADTYRPIACPLGEPFCVTTVDGQWPYESGTFDPSFPPNMCDQVELLGNAVATPESGPALNVRVDPEVVGSIEPSIACDGIQLDLCRLVDRGSTFHPGMVDSKTFSFRSPGPSGQALVLEVIEPSSDSPSARAHFLEFTDYWRYGEDCTYYTTTFEPSGGGRPVVASGEIVLSTAPDASTATRGRATIHTVDGGTLVLLF